MRSSIRTTTRRSSSSRARRASTFVQRKDNILRLDLRVPNCGPQGGNNPGGGFGNKGGRRLADDVVDPVFTRINNGVLITDFVNGNDVPLQNAFPFVADPTQPFPPGQNPRRGCLWWWMPLLGRAFLRNRT